MKDVRVASPQEKDELNKSERINTIMLQNVNIAENLTNEATFYKPTNPPTE